MIVILANEGRRRWAITVTTRKKEVYVTLYGIGIELKSLASPPIPKPELKHHQKSDILHMKCRWEGETASNMDRAVHCMRYR